MNRYIFFLLTTIIFLFRVENCFCQNSTSAYINDTSSTYALIVGISNYQNIKALKYADDDAYLFLQFLVNENICSRDKIYLLVDSLATTGNIYRDLSKIRYRVKKGDRVFLYFAGHGDVETELESGFLLSYNTEKNNYSASAIDLLMLERHVDALVNKNASVVLITDACRSGNLVGGISGASTTINSITKRFNNVIKLTSCLPNQLSQEKLFYTGGHGVFTYHLINGLSGLADKNNDKEISLREIDKYLDEVANETENKQNPKVDGNPLSVINEYNPQILASIYSHKGNSNYASRSTDFAKDTSWKNNYYYIQFLEKIQEQKYFSGIEPTAWSIINQAKQTNQPESMIKSMSYDLIAILEDNTQEVINRILQGEFSNQSQKEIRRVKNAIKSLELVIDMMDLDDVRKPIVNSKIVYFHCLDATIRHNYSKMHFYVDSLVKTDSLIPNQAWIKNLLGLMNYYLEDYDKARYYLLQATKIAPSWSSAWNNLGLAYNALDIYDSSRNAYLQSIKLEGFNDFGNGSALSNMSSLELKLKDTSAAEKTLLRAISMNKYNPYPYMSLGYLYDSQGDYLKAETYYIKGIQLDSIRAYYWLELATLYSKIKKYNKMILCVGRAISCDSTDLSSWLAAENIYKLSGMTQKAKELLINAAIYFSSKLNINSNSDEYIDVAYLFYQTDQLYSALRYINQYIKRVPDNVDAIMRKSEIELKMKNYSQSDSTMNIALKIDPNNKFILLQKGWLNFNYLKNDSLALQLFHRVLEIDSTDKEANYSVGRIHFYNSEFDMAITYFEKAVTYDSKSENAWYFLGLSNLYTALSQDTVTDYSDYEFLKTLELNPEMFRAYWYLGCVYYLKKDKKKASIYFNKSLKYKYKNTEIFKYNKLARIKSDKDFSFLISKNREK